MNTKFKDIIKQLNYVIKLVKEGKTSDAEVCLYYLSQEDLFAMLGLLAFIDSIMEVENGR